MLTHISKIVLTTRQMHYNIHTLHTALSRPLSVLVDKCFESLDLQTEHETFFHVQLGCAVPCCLELSGAEWYYQTRFGFPLQIMLIRVGRF